MNVSEILAAAQKAVDEADVAEDLRPSAFQKAVELLTAQQMSGTGQSASAEGSSQGPIATAEPLRRIAAKLGLPDDVIGEIFYEDDGEIGLSIPSGRLDATKTGGTRQLALLWAVGQQAAGREEWTPSSEIRRVCDYHGKFDSSNFSVTLAGMDEFFQIRGRSQSREVRAKQPGYEAATALVRALTMRNGG